MGRRDKRRRKQKRQARRIAGPIDPVAAMLSRYSAVISEHSNIRENDHGQDDEGRADEDGGTEQAVG